MQVQFKHGVVMKIDDEDWEKWKHINWYASYDKKTKSYYIICNKSIKNNISKTQGIHRLIMSAKKGQLVDHINHDTTDNRKENLRIVSYTLNNLNRRKNDNCLSNFIGVSFDKSKNKFTATVIKNKKQAYFKRFNDEIEAAKARDKYILDNNIKAILNFPKEEQT
jgi:hypothetical protein